nr:hypothetical protein [Tanacetum cinerariifolium]
ANCSGEEWWKVVGVVTVAGNRERKTHTRYQFLMVNLFNSLYSIHVCIDSSFFLTKSTGAPQGDELGFINPLLRSSYSFLDSSCTSDGAKRYGALATDAAPDTSPSPGIFSTDTRFKSFPDLFPCTTRILSPSKGIRTIFAKQSIFAKTLVHQFITTTTSKLFSSIGT